MPFTLVHPAAVLPLARGPLSLLALVAGAVAPDLPYYLRVTPLPVTADSWYEPYVNATASHSPEQLVWVVLPLAVVVYLCGLVVVPPLRSVAGIESSGSMVQGSTGVLVRGAWIVASLLIGAATHLAWDALTELGGSWSRLLQHGSTVLGLVVLAVVDFRRRTAIRWQDPTVRRRLVTAAVPCLLAAGTGAVIASWSWLDPAARSGADGVLEGVLTSVVKGGGVGLLAAVATLTLAWWILPGRRRG